MDYPLLVTVAPLEEGGFLAVCPQIEGCHAEGATIGQAIDNLQSVAQVIYELCREHGLPFISGVSTLPDAIAWRIEISRAFKVAA